MCDVLTPRVVDRLESILPLGDGLEVQHVPVAHTKESSTGYVSTFGTPFVISYPKASILSAEDVCTRT